MKKYIFFQTYKIIVDFRPMGMKGIKENLKLTRKRKNYCILRGAYYKIIEYQKRI